MTHKNLCNCTKAELFSISRLFIQIIYLIDINNNSEHIDFFANEMIKTLNLYEHTYKTIYQLVGEDEKSCSTFFIKKLHTTKKNLNCKKLISLHLKEEVIYLLKKFFFLNETNASIYIDSPYTVKDTEIEYTTHKKFSNIFTLEERFVLINLFLFNYVNEFKKFCQNVCYTEGVSFLDLLSMLTEMDYPEAFLNLKNKMMESSILNRDGTINDKELKNFLLKNKKKSEERIFNTDEFEFVYGFNPINEIGTLESPIMMNILKQLNHTPELNILSSKKKEHLLKVFDAFPNIQTGKHSVLSVIRNSFFLSENPNECKLPSMLLVGPPGCGKTELAMQLSEICQDNSIFISMGSGGGVTKLLGTSKQYKCAECGQVLTSFAKAISNKVIKNPIIILDEFEKSIFSGSNNEDWNMEATFCQLLETRNAKQIKDNFFDVSVDASKISYILTANDISKIPETILSRIDVTIEMIPYSKQELIEVVIPAIYKKFCEGKNKALLPNSIPKETSNFICDLNEKLETRKIKLILEIIADLSRNKKSNFSSMILTESQKNQFSNKKSNDTKKQKIGFTMNCYTE